VYNIQGNLGFDGSRLDWATLIVHTLLAFSSIIFRVPRKRIDRKPMIIYEEYRQHAMVFTFRCFSVFAVSTLYSEFFEAVYGEMDQRTWVLLAIGLMLWRSHWLG